jgi:glyoxylase-like metal-dependent hydrolase (beta-lactamase superfamily II)
VLLLRAGNASLWTGPTGNNTFLLAGRTPTLIDAGVGSPDHLDAVAGALGTRALEQVLLTHEHVDHVAGLPALKERWRGLRARGWAHGDEVIRDGERIEAGDTALVAIHTPGHTPEHLCFLDEGSRDVYCGDLVRLGGTIVIPASRGGDLVEYLASLRRVRDLRPRRLLPGHGPIIDEPARVIDEYLRHRDEREAEILSLLASSPATVTEIVTNVYRGIPHQFLAAAADSVLAHLRKLQNEGRVASEDGGWRRVSDR